GCDGAIKNCSGGGKDFKAEFTEKINKQLAKRGWTKESVLDTINNPHATSEALNKATGNAATAYFNADGSYVSVDDITHEIIQVSDKLHPDLWFPDNTIVNPYKP